MPKEGNVHHQRLVNNLALSTVVHLAEVLALDPIMPLLPLVKSVRANL